MKQHCKPLFSFLIVHLLLCFLSIPAFASGIEKTHHDEGDYRVHYSVFNSRFIRENTARALDIKRSGSSAIITIGVTKKLAGENLAGLYSLGMVAEVEGTATNLMQQVHALQFRAVQEGDVTYYIATLDHINEEVFHFDIRVSPSEKDLTGTIAFRFSRKLYTENTP